MVNVLIFCIFKWLRLQKISTTHQLNDLNMKQTFKYLVVILFLCSCAGSHGFIQRYEFDTSKTLLEQAVQSVLQNNATFLQEDQIAKKNDESGYITIFIKSEGDKYGYRLRYYGDEQHWKSSATSEIFIASARINGIGGKNSDEAMTGELKAKLLKVFKERFIDLISQAPHSESTVK